MTTFTHKIADRDCGMNQQIAVLLHALSQQEIDLPGAMHIRTLPYGNCRERGFVLSVSGATKKPQNLVFFEHRNTDQICAIYWEGWPHVTDVVRVDDIPKGAFPDKWTHDAVFEYMDIRGCIHLARGFIERLAAELLDAAE